MITTAQQDSFQQALSERGNHPNRENLASLFIFIGAEPRGGEKSAVVMPDKAQMPLKALAKSALLCQVPSIEQCTLHRTRACTLHYHTKHDTTGDTAKIRKGLRFSTWREGIRYLSTYFLFLFIYPALQKRRSPFRLAPCVHRCVSPVEYTPYANALKYSPLLDEICGARHLSRVNSWQ